jgi:hypothetical protein
MATNAQWTVIFEDKIIIKQGSKEYKIDNDTFWNDTKWSNIWAIQYKDDDHDYNDSVEYRDETPHATWTNSNLGNFRNQFVDKWDTAHLSELQFNWDNDNVDDETSDEKIVRLGARPTNYSSY